MREQKKAKTQIITQCAKKFHPHLHRVRTCMISTHLELGMFYQLSLCLFHKYNKHYILHASFKMQHVSHFDLVFKNAVHVGFCLSGWLLILTPTSCQLILLMFPTILSCMVHLGTIEATASAWVWWCLWLVQPVQCG